MSQEFDTFHDQLLFFLQDELNQKKREEGWDDRYDSQMRNYSDAISQAIRSSAPIPLEEIIEQHQYLFARRGPIHLEQKLLSAFSDQELTALQLKPIRIYRGLPRLYRIDQPQISKIKDHFSHLPSLKRCTAAKLIFSLYEQIAIPTDAKMVILCRVIPDGYGDYYAAIEVAKVIKNAFPALGISLMVMSDQDLPANSDEWIIRWTNEASQFELLKSCDLILEFPTCFLNRDQLKKEIDALLEDTSTCPKWESVGEYGFLESDWFHPLTNAHSMGLHFLEKGILTRTVDTPLNIVDLQNERLAIWLFGQTKIESGTIDQYRQNHRFFLAYLYSQAGIYVYLHALFKSLENDTKDIDLCAPDAAKLLSYFEQHLQANLDPIEKRYHIQQIVFCIGSHTSVLPIEPTGKTVRFLCPENLSSADFQRLMAFSEEFIACRGNQSVSEAISLNKCFFYDSRDHSRFFIKDLIALAQNRIAGYQSTVELLRLFSKILEHQLPQESDEWVDDIFVNLQKMDLLEIAETMGRYLQDPKTFVGFKKLNRILFEEHSCNPFILNLVRRAICHRRYPEIAHIEETELEHFATGQQSFSALVHALRDALSRISDDKYMTLMSSISLDS